MLLTDTLLTDFVMEDKVSEQIVCSPKSKLLSFDNPVQVYESLPELNPISSDGQLLFIHHSPSNSKLSPLISISGCNVGTSAQPYSDNFISIFFGFSTAKCSWNWGVLVHLSRY